MIYVLIILGPEIGKPPLEGTIKLYLIPVVIVTRCTEHIRSINMVATLGENHKTIVYTSCNGFYMYWVQKYESHFLRKS